MKSKIFQEVLEDAPVEMNEAVMKYADLVVSNGTMDEAFNRAKDSFERLIKTIEESQKWIKDTQSGKIKYTK